MGAEDFIFKKTEEGYILEEYRGKDTDIKIPESYNGEPVVAIGDGAFKKTAFLIESVFVPASVKEIGEYAFSYTISLKNLTLSEGIKVLKEGFLAASAVSELNIPASVKIIERPDLIECQLVCPEAGFFASDGFGIYQKNYKSDNTSEGLALIAVNPNDGRKEYEILPNTKIIGKDSIRHNAYLKDLIIPESVSHIEDGALSFAGNPTNEHYGLCNVSVSEKNKNIFVKNRAVYEIIGFENNKQYKLIRVFNEKNDINLSKSLNINEEIEFDVYKGTEVIGREAFLNSSVNILRLPDTVRDICENAFERAEIYDIFYYPLEDGKPKEKEYEIYFKTDNRFVIADMLSGFGKNGKIYDYRELDNFLTREYLLAERIAMIAKRLKFPFCLDVRDKVILENKIRDNIFDVVRLLADKSDVSTLEDLGELGLIDENVIFDIIDMTTSEGKDEITAWFMEFKNRIVKKDESVNEEYINGFLKL